MNTMIVEDNVPFRKLFKDELLSRFPSMEVIEARNGEEAFRALASSPIDLIFMDIRLPGQNGLQLTRKIKADRHDMPIIIVSSHDSSEYREIAIRCGASCFVSKNSFNIEGISTFISCFQKAKDDGRLGPTCLRLESDEFCH
jgi:two-component system OmpR family response regulator